jgi:hypothetical protein
MNNKGFKIAIYYIATGSYKKLFPDFLESVQNFFPNNKKIVKLLSDGLEEYANYENGNVKVELCPRINNYPWPIVTLYKMWHILENFDDTCEYSCYFNGNATICEHSVNALDFNKLTVSYHSFNGKDKSYNPWPHIKTLPNSTSYLINETYEYVQGGFFWGPSKLVRKLCEDVVNMIKVDTDNHVFACWHNESYLNKWCVLHENLVVRKYIMTIYKDDVDKERFVYLRDKGNYQIDKDK